MKNKFFTQQICACAQICGLSKNMRIVMYVIGLTGGVGSGKTAVADKLAELAGAELLIADELGHLVMKKDTEGYHKVVEAFGTGILDIQGEIDRKRLSKIVFEDSGALERLNQIIHPAVKAYLKEYIDKRRGEEGCLVLETAIMFETGCDELCDEVWYVCVPSEIRIERLAANRGYSEEKSQAIMKKQLEEEEFRRRCTREIWNGGSVQELEAEIRKLLGEADFFRNNTRPVPIGIEFYKEMVDGGFYYVDKTMLICDLLKQGSNVVLFTRPRRFGKTLAQTMFCII